MYSAIKQGCLNAIHPCTIVADPLSGRYSGALWLAWPLFAREVPVASLSPVWRTAELFWRDKAPFVGRGMTPNEAYDQLYQMVFTPETVAHIIPSGKLTVVA